MPPRSCFQRFFCKTSLSRSTCISLFDARFFLQVIEDVRSLHHDARLLLAGNLLRRVDEYLSQATDRDRKEIKAAVKLLEGKNKGNFDDLRRRAAECISTLRDWHSVRVNSFRNVTKSSHTYAYTAPYLCGPTVQLVVGVENLCRHSSNQCSATSIFRWGVFAAPSRVGYFR